MNIANICLCLLGTDQLSIDQIDVEEGKISLAVDRALLVKPPVPIVVQKAHRCTATICAIHLIWHGLIGL